MKNRHIVLLIAALAFVLSVPWASRPFSSRGEPREALVAQAMLQTGNWISPPAYDGAVPSKPPFTHWLMALTSLPRGEVTEISARLPGSIAFVAFMAYFAAFVARRYSPHRAVAASMILLTSPEWFRAASSARVDTILATSLAGGLLALFSWQERGRSGIPWLGIGCIAAATLTKGPVALVVAAACIGLYALLTERVSLKSVGKLILDALVVALPVVAIAAIWYLLAYQQRGDEFLSKVWYENVQRFAGTQDDEPHSHTALYLWALTLVGLLPWSIITLGRLVSERRSWWGRRGEWKEVWHNLHSCTRFSLIVAAVFVLFFSIPASKRSVYLLPAYPFFALLLVGGWEASRKGVAAVQSHWRGRVLRGSVFVLRALAVLLPLALIGVVVSDVILSNSPVIRALAVNARLLLLDRWTLGFLGAGTLWAVWTVRSVSSQIGDSLEWFLGLPLFVTITVANLCVVGPIAGVMSPKEWLRSVTLRQQVPVDDIKGFYSFGSENYAASFYLAKPFSRLEASIPANAYIFVERRNLDQLRAACRPAYTGEIVELSRFRSVLESAGRDVLVVRSPVE